MAGNKKESGQIKDSHVAEAEFTEIIAFAAELQDLQQQKAAALAPIVQNILQKQSKNINEIERTLDHLLDCACVSEGLALFKSLCRYYFTLNPTGTADYINAYREMWDNQSESEMEG